jgi:hypothetical protein
MRLLNRIARKLRPYAVRNLTLYLVAGQVVVYALSLLRPGLLDSLALVPRKVLEGEPWRLVSFVVMPPLTNPIFAFFAWYLFWLMGTALEREWGALRYDAYLLIAFVATVGVSFVTPDLPATNVYIAGSVFLAFAYLFPDFRVLLMFFFPVKVKWLAAAAWIGLAVQFGMGSWQVRLAAGASVANFLLFFGRDIAGRVVWKHRRLRARSRAASGSSDVMHRCAVCGITNVSDPDAEFRYCGECEPTTCYCMDHIFDHEHVRPSKKRRKDKP